MSLLNSVKKQLRKFAVVRKLSYLRSHDPKEIYLQLHPDAPDIPSDVKKDMRRCVMKYGCLYDEYFYFDFLNHKDKAYRRSYITDFTRFKYYNKLNKPENEQLFDDKYLTWQTFSRYYKRKLLRFHEDTPLDALREFIGDQKAFAAKQNFSACGNGIVKVNVDDFDSIEQLAAFLIKNNHTILEELIIQADPMASLHPASLNTLRIPVVRMDDENIVFVSPFVRMGRGGSFVDNVGSGGIFARIDVETGKLSTDGYDTMNNLYPTHPDTGVRLKGFQIPDWEAAKALVKELAFIVPSNRYTGWDIAYTADGWVMVEGNSKGQFRGAQILGCGLAPQMDEILSRIQ